MKKFDIWVRPRRTIGLAAVLASCLSISSQAGVFDNNFNSDPSGVINILDVAKWVNSGGVDGSGYISLTDALNDQAGTIYIDDLDGGSPVGGFLATFKLRIGGGSGNPADGFSFNFGNDLSGSTFGEDGTGSGIRVSIDTYDNGAGEAPAIDVWVGGTIISTVKFVQADLLTGDQFVDVRIEWRDGLLDVDYKGQPVFNDLPLGLAPIEGGMFGIGARTGGENDNHWIDNLHIETFARTTPAVGAVRATANGVVVKLVDATGAAVDASTVTATFDGAAAAGTATKSGDSTIFAFSGPTLLDSGTSHPVVVNFKYGSAATAGSLSFSVTTPTYTVVPAATALASGAVDTSKRGFIWRIHQVDSASTLATTKARAVNQLAGLLGNNVADPSAAGAASGPASAPSPATAPIDFVIPDVINLSQAEGTTLGNVTPDLQMPGVPGLGSLAALPDDNMAAAVLTAIEFPAAGTYTFIVNSDDGFETSVGTNPSDVFAQTVGAFEGERGASDTVFNVYIQAPGLYAFRTLWYEGNGDANIEWLAIAPDETRVLLNDTTTSPQALKTYQLPASAVPAYVQVVSPAPDTAPLLQATNVTVSLVDSSTQVDSSSITLKLNGNNAPVTANKSGGVTKVVYSGGLTGGTDYTAELTYSDGTPHTVTWSFNSGLVGLPLFVIEAEDFDSNGEANPQKGVEGMDVDVMPYYGGAYDGLDATEGVDYNNDDGNDSDIYRTELDENGENEVNISARDNIAGGNGLGGAPSINSSDRITYTTTVNYGIGWVGSGNWQNYTRNFPNNGTAGWWRVFAGLSYGGSDPGQLSGSLDLITDGVGTPDQTTEPLGQFSAPGSGNWANNNLVPMTTASGDTAVVKLVGKQTVRFNTVSGDFDFLIFSPAPAPPPAVESVPLDSAVRTNVVLDWVLRDTDTKVNVATVKVQFNSQDVTSKAVSTKTDTGATVHLDLSSTTYDAGEYPWALSFSDNSTPPQTVNATGTFVVVPYPGEGIFTIEAEDFNYSEDGVTGGKTNPQKGTEGLDVDVMPYIGGAYDGLSAVEGVDYNNNDANDSDMYRTELDENGENEVNVGSSNGNRYSNDRGSFELTNNYRIGWVESGSWQDYTRTIPQGSYNVWAALSYGGRGGGQLNASLDMVTSDPTKPSQTTQRLGAFNAPGSGDWGRNELVPMKNDDGSFALVNLGGAQTFRFNLGSGDFDYFILVPASATTQPKFTSVARTVEGLIKVEWTGGGTLEAAPAVTGPWQAVPGATSPYTFTPTGAQLFGRIKQ